MRKYRSKLLVSSLTLILTVGMASLAANAQHFVSEPAKSPTHAEVIVGPMSLEFDFRQDANLAILRVSGPDRYALSVRTQDSNYLTAHLSDDANVSFLADDDPARQNFWEVIPDGKYTFELMVYTDDGLRHTTRGEFEVSHGSALPGATMRHELDDDLSSLNHQQNEASWFESLAGKVLDAIIPSAQAQSGSFDNWINIWDDAEDDATRINMRNTNETDLSLHNWQGSFRINEGTGTGSIGSEIFMISSMGKLGIHTSDPQSVLHVNSPDLNFNEITLEDTRGAWAVSTGGLFNDLGFRIRNVTDGSTPFRIERGAPGSSIRVASDGNVGFGASSPEANIHVQSDARAGLLLDAGADSQSDFSLLQDGTARWVFRNRAATNNFEIARRHPDGGALDRPLIISFTTGQTILRNGVQVVDSSEPNTPFAGGTLFVDQSDGNLKVKFENGTVRTIAAN